MRWGQRVLGIVRDQSGAWRWDTNRDYDPVAESGRGRDAGGGCCAMRMEKTSVPDCSLAIDIEGYRERISAAVGLEVSELASAGKDPNVTMRRRYAAYILSAAR